MAFFSGPRLDSLGVVGLGLVVLSWANAELFPPVSGVAVTAMASSLGFLGVCLGAVLGASRWGRRGMIAGSIVLGMGGIMAGMLVGGTLMILVTPAARVLGLPGPATP